MVDRAKAIADYPLLENNAFWQYFWEAIEKQQDAELSNLATTSELPEIYRAQGRVETWGRLPRFVQDLAERLKR